MISSTRSTLCSWGLLALSTLCTLSAYCAAVATPTEEPAAAQLGHAPTYKGDLATLAAVNIRDARLHTVADGWTRPRAMAMLDSTRVLITEMAGQLTELNVETGQRTVISGLPAVASEHEQAGLIDIELHPQFGEHAWIYISYVSRDPQAPTYYRTQVSRARLEDAKLHDLQPIVDGQPYGWAPSNFGGALEFDADGKLYVSIGDRGEHDLAQRGDRLEGKVLRLNDDGSIPADNPFVADPLVDDRIYALGLRNAQGLHFDPPSGLLFEAEHGPLGGDEINILRAGANYGWPVVTYGSNYNTEPMGKGTHLDGMLQPIFYYLPSEAISPLVRYRGKMFKEWDGDLLAGALKGEHVSKLDLDGEVVRSEYPILRELGGRVRDIEVASDGSIYFLVQTGTLYRLTRSASTTNAAAAVEPAVIYGLVCAGCHDHGSYGAPNPAVATHWTEVLKQERAQIHAHTLNGKGAMPARGMCHLCNDEHLQQTVDWMLERVQSAPEDAN